MALHAQINCNPETYELFEEYSHAIQFIATLDSYGVDSLETLDKSYKITRSFQISCSEYWKKANNYNRLLGSIVAIPTTIIQSTITLLASICCTGYITIMASFFLFIAPIFKKNLSLLGSIFAARILSMSIFTVISAVSLILKFPFDIYAKIINQSDSSATFWVQKEQIFDHPFANIQIECQNALGQRSLDSMSPAHKLIKNYF